MISDAFTGAYVYFAIQRRTRERTRPWFASIASPAAAADFNKRASELASERTTLSNKSNIN
jgi:hypothetical protein